MTQPILRRNLAVLSQIQAKSQTQHKPLAAAAQASQQMVTLNHEKDKREFVDLLYPSLSEKNILLTGGSSGIGNATAKKLLKNGANLICLGRRTRPLQQLSAYPKKKGTLRVVHCDLERPIQLKSTFQQVMQEIGGRLDGLINCAGLLQNKDYRDTLLDQWDRMMTVNLRAPLQLMSMSVPYMRATGGSIVNISDTSVPKPKQTIFCVSKACINSLTQCAALELGGFGIRVNSVAPGVTHTATRVGESMSAEENEQYMRRAASASVAKKVAHAKDVANTIVWLISDQSSFVNGEIITVDGGEGLANPLGMMPWKDAPVEQPSENLIARGFKRFFA